LERPRLGVSVKLITTSTLLLVVMIGLFGVVNSMQSRRLIDDSTAREREKIVAGLRVAGVGQLSLFAEAVRIALLQNDYTTLGTMVDGIGKRDELVTEAAVVDNQGTILAHINPKLVGGKAQETLGKLSRVDKVESQMGVMAGGQTSIVFAAPVKDAGARLSTVFLAYSLRLLNAELARAEDLKRKEVRASIRSTLTLGLLVIGVGVLLTILQGLSISRPIRALARQADRIASGDLGARVQIRSHDEIGLLGDRFNFMAQQVLSLMRETMEKASLRKELEVASAVQSTLVPSASVVELPGVRLAGHFSPATQCGGDWWGHYTAPDGRVLIVIGDVTGHGVGSAMITAAAKGAATALVTLLKERLDLQSLLKIMNTAIQDAARGRFFMTCFASIYEPRTRSLSFANAGHTFPYLFEGRSGNLVSLGARGNILGDTSASEYETKQIKINTDDVVVWYTDGLVECEGPRGDEFGEKRFRSSIRQHAHLPPDQARDQITQHAVQFYGEVPQKDDITLIVGKFA